MTTITQLSRNYLLSSLYASYTVNKSSFNSQQNQLNSNFQSLQTFSKLSAQKFQNQQEEYRNTVSNFTKNIQNVNNSVKSLTSNTIFNEKYVSISAGTAISGQAQSKATSAQYAVSVSQLAASQENKGKAITANAYGDVAAGSYTLGIQMGSNAERQISVNVLTTDTNKDVLNKLASAINSSESGVKAEITTKDNSQSISITSKTTGAATSFAIRDISNTMVASLQLDNKVKNATDAIYKINDVDYQSATNKIALDNNNVSLNLNATTTGSIKVNVGKDNSKIVEATKNLITNYNNLHNVFNNSDSTTALGDIILNSVNTLVGKTKATDFASIGITLDKSNGILNLDETKLADALTSNPDRVKSLLSGSSSLGKSIERVSQQIATTPVSSYFKPPNPLDMLNYNAQSISSNSLAQGNPFMQGLFFNILA